MMKQPSRKPSLITEPQRLRLPKIGKNTTVQPSQNNIDGTNEDSQPCEVQEKKNRFFALPQMKKILYSPVQNPKKAQTNRTMVQTCVRNKSYQDMTDELIEIQIKEYFRRERAGSKLHRDSCLFLKNKMLVGKQAPLDYYKDYKKMNQLIQCANANKENYSDSPYLAMLNQIQKKQLLPMCMGVVKYKGDASILNINNYKLGDKYIEAMSSGLKQAKMIEQCLVSGNRITDKGLQELSKNLNQQISVLDLSYNKIKTLNDKIMLLIVDPQARLEKLNLQSNQLNNQKCLESLFSSSTVSKHLKVLNLRNNSISTQSTQSVCQLIDSECVLEQLYLGKNFLTSKSGQKIFNKMSKNKMIKIFDYSLNHLGQEDDNACARAISEFFTKNKTLHHLDLSYNNFDQEGSKIIAEGLQTNKKLYGIHFSGNYGYIDSRGFLIIQQKEMTTLHSIVESKIDSYNICYNRQAISVAPTQFKNVCWICEGWYEQDFRFTVPDDFTEEKKFVYLHFDFQLFKPRLINLTEKNVKYTTMVPPKKYRYFFTFNNKQFTDEKAKTVNLQFPQTFEYEMCHRKQSFQVEKTSERKGKQKKMVNDWNEVIIKTLPRNTGLVSKKQKEIWTYAKSAWAKQWKLENNDSLAKCFERDWKCTKLMNLVKNQADQDKLKDLLKQNYKQIKMIYRYYSSWNPLGDIWAISNNPWTEFCQHAKIINKDTPLKITDLTFITTNSMSGADWKGNQLVPERGLIRFQFMEALVRLAEQKFKKNGLTQNFTESVKLMLKDHILPLALSLTHETWRAQKYFTQGNDMLIKRYRPIFSYIYKKNSKAKVKPGDKPFMCLNEFKSITQRANIAGTYVLQRDIFVSFNESMMTQIDEIQNERFMRMSEIEFIQALARCAEILPQTCCFSEKGKSESPQPIHYRFEWLIRELKNTQCNQDIKGQFSEAASIFDEIDDD